MNTLHITLPAVGTILFLLAFHYITVKFHGKCEEIHHRYEKQMLELVNDMQKRLTELERENRDLKSENKTLQDLLSHWRQSRPEETYPHHPGWKSKDVPFEKRMIPAPDYSEPNPQC